MQAEPTIGFIGAGNMATALIGGLVDRVRDPERVVVFDPDTDKTDRLRKRCCVQIAGDNAQILRSSDVVVIAVKPQVMRDVLLPLRPAMPEAPPLIVSVAAGIRIASIEKWLDRRLGVTRVMPNTPSLVGAGASGLYANDLVSADQRELAETLMQSVGIATWVDDEQQLDTVTGIAGSGPAYFMLFMEAMVEAAAARGLDKDTAHKLVVQTCRGAAELAGHGPESLAQLRINVTSPGGTTERALETMKADGADEIIRNAVYAAADRAEELANTLAEE
ncbi:MAG: Pyrroline-5-carboxylate reductase [Gammaproteobacteria bacterium]|nr:Pyrroline-5-carboxylate reductase [Gammaproteobacteria bacterium]